MLDELLYELNYDQKINLLKYAAVFAGGILVGYSIKKVVDSYDFDEIKANAYALADDYINPKRTYDVEIEEVVDEENLDE